MSKENQEREWEESWVPSQGGPGLETALRAIHESYADMQIGRVAPEWSDAQTRARVAEVDLSEAIGLDAATRGSCRPDATRRPTQCECALFWLLQSNRGLARSDCRLACGGAQPADLRRQPRAGIGRDGTRGHSLLAILLGIPRGCGRQLHFRWLGSKRKCSPCRPSTRQRLGFATQGVRAYPKPPSLYASADSHLAWIKIARAAGLGADAVAFSPHLRRRAHGCKRTTRASHRRPRGRVEPLLYRCHSRDHQRGHGRST